ncbi:MAG: histidine kinase [Phenylobacterium sp.]|uniref:sensor histidine kinase n=1 Tax=Phenylobacterium sp. TaxID=1871053 RepID=UPI0025CEBBC6|nr:ATP-binding protein [Phenylobacterium sp.]MBI1198842.1 histidine kinase [Phenylobacterium sp.]
MVSRRRLTRIAALLGVAAAGGLAVLALRAELPANALLASLAAIAAGLWLVTRDEPAPAPAPPAEGDAVRLDQERERRTLQAYLDQTPTPLVLAPLVGPLTAVNRAARRLFHTDGVLPDPSPELAEAIATASPETRRTVRLASGDGPPRTYALSVAEVTGGGGPVRLAALTDIEAEIQAAEAAALKELLQVLSHEIMNSLTPLASLAQSAAELLEEGERQDVATARESVAVIARRTDGLHRFVEAYRQLARLPAPQPRLVSLGDLIDEAARLFETRWGARGVALEAVRPRPDIRIRLDPDLTAQALISLLANAAQAALANTADGTAPPTVRLSARPAGEGAAIVVEDNGAGVDPARAGEIFKPFFTTKPEGSGIGLSLARQAVVSQGGQLVLDPPRAGEGARFTIAL